MNAASTHPADDASTTDRQRADHGSAVIVVVGAASVLTPADVAVLDLAVEQTAKTAADAFESVARRTLDVITALGALVDRQALRTTDLSLQTQYDFEDGTQRFTGYTARQSLTVHGVEPGRLGELLTAVVTAGGDHVRIDRLNLQPTDPGPAKQAAREQAFRAAREQAEQLAALAGRRTGAAQRIVELDSHQGGPAPFAKAQMFGAADMPIAAGDRSVDCRVEVHFALLD